MKEGNTALPRIEELFRDRFRPLTVFAMHYVKEQAVAEDIVQDLFLYLYEKLEEGKEEFPENYYYTLVKYRCLNKIAHEKLRNERQNEIETMYSNPHDPMELVESLELENKYLQALETLPVKRRKVFELSRVEGKSNQEIAKKLDLSKRTVETHITHALKDIREQLSNYLTPALLLIILYEFLFKYEDILVCLYNIPGGN